VGERDIAVGEALLGLAVARLERLTARDRLALPRRPRGQTARERAAAEVRLRLLARDAGDRAGHADLAVQLRPVEDERRVRVRLQLPPLAALVVRVERKAALVEPLEQHHARGRPAV